MIHKKYVKRRAEAALRLLSGKTLSSQALEAVDSLIRGLDTTLDTILDQSTSAFSDLKTYEKSTIVELTESEIELVPNISGDLQSYRMRCIHLWRELKHQLSQITQETTGDVSPVLVEFLRVTRHLRQPTAVAGVVIFLVAAGILINLYTAQMPSAPRPENGQVKGVLQESSASATRAPSPLR